MAAAALLRADSNTQEDRLDNPRAGGPASSALLVELCALEVEV